MIVLKWMSACLPVEMIMVCLCVYVRTHLVYMYMHVDILMCALLSVMFFIGYLRHL